MDNVELLPMTASDYDEVRSLWMTIRGFGIRVLVIIRGELTIVAAESVKVEKGDILIAETGRAAAETV